MKYIDISRLRESLVIGLGIIFVLLAVFWSWKFERWLNWKLSYQSQVNELTIDLKKRIESLETRVSIIETNEFNSKN